MITRDRLDLDRLNVRNGFQKKRKKKLPLPREHLATGPILNPTRERLYPSAPPSSLGVRPAAYYHVRARSAIDICKCSIYIVNSNIPQL